MFSDLIFDLTTYALVTMSALTWTIAIAKVIQLHLASRRVEAYATWFSQQDDWQAVTNEALKPADGDAAFLVKSMLSVCREYGGTEQASYTFEQLQEMLSREMQRKLGMVTRHKESWLNALASIGSTAPFLGLFGTVWGIMQALVMIGETGAASITVVAAPIGGALITTAIGIVTAIPAVIFFNILSRLVRLHLGRLENFSERLLRYSLDNRNRWREVSA